MLRPAVDRDEGPLLQLLVGTRLARGQRAGAHVACSATAPVPLTAASRQSWQQTGVSDAALQLSQVCVKPVNTDTTSRLCKLHSTEVAVLNAGEATSLAAKVALCCKVRRSCLSP